MSEVATSNKTWQAWLPADVSISRKERWRAVAGAVLGMAFAALLSSYLGSSGGTLWLMAPLGASAVLVFAVPTSPLAQPWAVMVGNTLSALVGVACASVIPDTAVAGSVAVGLAILVMFATRSLHPPGGASALFAVLSNAHSPWFALFPVATNSALLLLAALLYHKLNGKRYPHQQVMSTTTASERFTAADLDAALAHFNDVIDVSRADLAELLNLAEAQVYQRRLGDLKCADIMSRQVITAEFGMTLEAAWKLMRERQIKALPVIDRGRRLIGIVTAGDFLKHARIDQVSDVAERIKRFLAPTPHTHSDKPEVVGQIMTRKVRVASADRSLVELLPLLVEGGHRHIPILDTEGKVAGIITQSDLIRALYQATLAKEPAASAAVVRA